jgi:3-dehydroquinate dehydratase II
MVINGSNLNMLGIREKSVYGSLTIEDINKKMLQEAELLGVEIEFFQSNHEGYIIDKIHSLYGEYQALIINPGAFTHYSYAIRDAIKSISIPAIEVHISNIHNREEFRKTSVIAPVCSGQISGLGIYSYIAALKIINEVGERE